MPLTQLNVTLDATIQTYNTTGRIIHPGDNNPAWWTTVVTTGGIYLDPQNHIHVRSVETNTIGTAFMVMPHPELASLNCNVHEIAAYDASGRFYFTLSNDGYQTIMINPGDNLAVINY